MPGNVDNPEETLRFNIGDRVEARWSDKGFRTGTIVALNYQERGWLGDVPYQIQLDGNRAPLIYAPFDDDTCVRALPACKDCNGRGTCCLTAGKRRRQ